MTVKEYPILMKGRMAQGCHEGWKMQSRRVLKVRPPAGNWRYDGVGSPDPDDHDEPECHWLEEMIDNEPSEYYIPIGKCPFGKVGDRLWVREAFRMLPDYAEDATPTVQYEYRADGVEIHPADPWKWSPSIHMPRDACRTVLELTDVRVERLQDISEEDAKAEGVEPNWCGPLDRGRNSDGGIGWNEREGWRNYLHNVDGEQAFSAIESFSTLWDSLAKPSERWKDNPWVFVLSFKRVNL